MKAGQKQSWTESQSKGTRNQEERGKRGEGGREGQVRTKKRRGREEGRNWEKSLNIHNPKKYHVGEKKKKISY